MVSKTAIQFAPEYATHPGLVLSEELESRGMSQVDLAMRTGHPPKVINHIINGKAPLTPDTALQLERVLGVPASIWNSLEAKYNEAVARLKERERLENSTHLLKSIPVRELLEKEWMEERSDPIDQLLEVLKFFGIADFKKLDSLFANCMLAFRKSPSFESDKHAIQAWLRKGEADAQDIQCAPYDSKRFRSALFEIRGMTTKKPSAFSSEMRRLCADSGVALVFTTPLMRTRVSGASRWLNSEKALIQLSLRGKYHDGMWFTFFHEAGHILLEGKRDCFVDFERPGKKDEAEDRADSFAEEMLVPREKLSAFLANDPDLRDARAIRAFAAELGIDPGIVVGRLHFKEAIHYSLHTKLKRRFTPTDERLLFCPSPR